MADFSGMVMTQRGIDLETRAKTGVPIIFTRAAIGDGTWADGTSPETVTALAHERITLGIQGFKTPGDGTTIVQVVVTNEGLEQGVFCRELGLYADDPTYGEILYAVTYAGDKYDYLPAAGSVIVEKVLDLIVVVGNATTVSAVISDRVIIATKEDIAAHDADASAHPEMHTPAPGLAVVGVPQVDEGGVLTLQLVNREDYDGDVDIRLRIVDAPTGGNDATEQFVVAQADSLVHVTAPQIGAATDFYVYWQVWERGLIRTGWSTVPLAFRVLDVPIDQPLITDPTPGATVGEAPTLTASLFASDLVQTHQSSQWQIGSSAAFSALVHDSGETVVHLTTYDIPSGVLQANTTYYLRVRYRGSLGGWSPWSAPVAVSTPSSFVTPMPVLTGTMSGYEGTTASGTITNFDPEAAYVWSVPTALQSTWVFHSDTGAWSCTLPTVNEDTPITLGVYATRPGIFRSGNAEHEIQCLNVPIYDGPTITIVNSLEGWPDGDFEGGDMKLVDAGAHSVGVNNTSGRQFVSATPEFTLTIPLEFSDIAGTAGAPTMQHASSGKISAGDELVFKPTGSDICSIVTVGGVSEAGGETTVAGSSAAVNAWMNPSATVYCNRSWKLQNGAILTHVAFPMNNLVSTVWPVLVRRNSAGNYTVFNISTSAAFTNDGDFRWYSLTTEFLVPDTGDFYVAFGIGGIDNSMAYNTASSLCSRASINGFSGNVTMTEDSAATYITKARYRTPYTYTLSDLTPVQASLPEMVFKIKSDKTKTFMHLARGIQDATFVDEDFNNVSAIASVAYAVGPELTVTGAKVTYPDDATMTRLALKLRGDFAAVGTRAKSAKLFTEERVA